MKLIFHPEAHEEMIESARFYEGKSEGLGSDFLTAVEETTHRIKQFPEAGPIDRAKIRRRLVFMHQQRRPGYWRNRLQT